MDAANPLSAAAELTEAIRLFEQYVPPEQFSGESPPSAATVYTPWIVAWLLVYQRLIGNGSLQAAVAELCRLGPDHLPDNKRTREHTLSARTGAYSKARQQLSLAAMQSAADRVTQTLLARRPGSWQGRQVFAIDGSTLTLAPTEELLAAFPPATNQHGESYCPTLHWVTAHEVSQGIAARPEVGAMYGPQAMGEVAIAGRLLARLPAGSLFLGDRNFSTFAFAWNAKQADHEFVLRLTESRFRALLRQAKPTGENTWTLTWRPSANDRRRTPGLPADAALLVHLCAVPLDANTTLWLLSSVTASAAELAALYRQRATIESDFRDLKRTLRLEEIRGQSVAMVLKELAAAAIAFNLIGQIRVLAAERIRVEPRRLSFGRIATLVRTLLLPLNLSDPELLRQRIAMVLRMASQCKLPLRPGRNYPRVAIPKASKFPPRKRHAPPESTK
jgi:hypothetical protein